MEIVAWKCTDCGQIVDGDESLKDGTRCSMCRGKLEPVGEYEVKSRGLTVSVEMKGLNQFKLILGVLGELIADERIPEAIRMEYASKIVMKE
jgi:hypothetical protein